MGDARVSHRFGRNLSVVRRRAGVSQEELGFRSGLHRTEIGLLERGERTPRIDTVVKLVAALDLHIDCPLFDGIAWNAGVTTTVPGSFTLSAPVEDLA